MVHPRSKYRESATLLCIAVAACIVPSATVGSVVLPAQSSQQGGYTDTPFLPDGKWRVHDANRPRPRTVTAAVPLTLPPPSDAVVLFDGKDLSSWIVSGGPKHGTAPAWKVQDGYMEVVGGSGTIESKEHFGDCQIHLEWAAPAEVSGAGQGRGNSGVLLMGRYEIQVLDSFDNLTYADGQAGAMYGQYPPLVNGSRKPGEWQSYDIIFEAPQFADGKVAKPAQVTVLHNGVLLHHRQPFIGQVAHRLVGQYRPHDARGPLVLQDHRNPVRFRNIWVRPLGHYDEAAK